MAIPLPPSATPVSLSLPGGQWQQIGNPFNYSQATVCGSGVSVFTYDPATGAYSPSTTLNLGQGAWAYAPVDTTITFITFVPVLLPPGSGLPGSMSSCP